MAGLHVSVWYLWWVPQVFVMFGPPGAGWANIYVSKEFEVKPAYDVNEGLFRLRSQEERPLAFAGELEVTKVWLNQIGLPPLDLVAERGVPTHSPTSPPTPSCWQ